MKLPTEPGLLEDLWHPSRVGDYRKLVLEKLDELIQIGKRIMSDNDDLAASVAKVGAAVTAAANQIATMAAELANHSDPAVAAAAVQLSAMADTLNAAVNPPPGQGPSA